MHHHWIHFYDAMIQPFMLPNVPRDKLPIEFIISMKQSSTTTSMTSSSFHQQQPQQWLAKKDRFKKWFAEAKTTLAEELVQSPNDDLFFENGQYILFMISKSKTVCLNDGIFEKYWSYNIDRKKLNFCFLQKSSSYIVLKGCTYKCMCSDQKLNIISLYTSTLKFDDTLFGGMRIWILCRHQ